MRLAERAAAATCAAPIRKAARVVDAGGSDSAAEGVIGRGSDALDTLPINLRKFAELGAPQRYPGRVRGHGLDRSGLRHAQQPRAHHGGAHGGGGGRRRGTSCARLHLLANLTRCPLSGG